MDTTMENLPAGIVVKDVNSDFCYIYRNRESYNRDMSFENETTGMTDFDYYPQEVARTEAKRRYGGCCHRKMQTLGDGRKR